MSKKSYVLAAALSGWFRERKAETPGFTESEAAKCLGCSLASFKKWRNGEPISENKLQGALTGLGVETPEQANQWYVADAEFVQFYFDFSADSERVFLANLARAREIRETRVCMPSYWAISHEYRSRLNAYTYERMENRNIRVKKVEQIANLDRAIDLLCNIERFSGVVGYYDIRILPYFYSELVDSALWIPYLNFSIFDHRVVLAGGIHKKGPPTGEPFINMIGDRYAAFFMTCWERLWNEAAVLSARETSDRLDLALAYIRMIPGCSNVTAAEIKEKVSARLLLVDRYPPRF